MCDVAKPKGFFPRPPGPFAGMWSWKHLDWIKTAKMITSKRVVGFYEDFPNAVPLGSKFPEIELRTTDGGTVNTNDFVGKSHVVLFTGAIT